jgi:hypothetical protein
MLIYYLYKKNWKRWRNLDSIHLLINHRHYLDEKSPINEFDELNILNYSYTFGYMSRDVMNRIKDYINESIS